MMPDTDAIQCPICSGSSCGRLDAQSEDYECRVPTRREFAIYQCRGCGAQCVWPHPKLDELIDFYPEDYHAYNEDRGWIAGTLVARRDLARQRRCLDLTSGRPVRLFDVGQVERSGRQ